MSCQRSQAIAYSFKVLLPNGTTLPVTLTNPGSEMTVNDFIKAVRDEYVKTKEDSEVAVKKRKTIDWDSAALSCLDFYGVRINHMVRFDMFKPDVCNIIRIDDGPGGESILYENMWDLTPETELLRELPGNYGFQTAITELIDNSLQALWSCPPGDRKLIRVSAVEGRFSVFDSGPGMDSSTIDKWGRIGASAHRSQKSEAIGCNPPYLMPFFGMFGYGAPYACMFLGRRTLLSTKTKESNKVLILQLDQDALIDNGSISGINWKAAGGMRDPSEEEMKLSPHGSFTKVEIFDWKCRIPNIKPFQRKLQDIYFPYIQCDELSTTGKIERPVEFWVGKENLAEISGGVVATTNLNSQGDEFWFQIRFINRGTAVQEAHARLKFAYFPILKRKESIDIILESLEKDVIEDSESLQTFRRIFVRRLGRLLPKVSWASMPFMERGARATTLQKCCGRVICFVDLDAGFDPTPSKTDLASHNPFTVALKNFGCKLKTKDNDVQIEIHRAGSYFRYGQMEKCYQEWVLAMHRAHDVEDASGEDEPTIVFDSLDAKALCISPNCEAVRVHEIMKNKDVSWKRGQKIKILKGACAGAHKDNLHATIEYFLIEGFSDEAGGDARLICRQIKYSEDEGCTLLTDDGIPRLVMRSSQSFPVSIIDSGMCLHIDENAWNKKIQRLEKKSKKYPSRIDLLDESDCKILGFNGESTLGDSVTAGQSLPQQIVAVVRPASFTSSNLPNKLDQKHIVKMDGEMLMEVELQDGIMRSRDQNAKPLYSYSSSPTSREGFHGLYIFPLESNMFKNAGTYNFCFSVGDSVTCKKRLVVGPASKVGSWKLASCLESINVRLGSYFPPCSIAYFDEYDNQMPFTSVPNLEVKLKAGPGFEEVTIDQIEANLTDHGILEVKNILVVTYDVDQIRPDYETNLEICSKDEPCSVSVPCKVNPGPLVFGTENNPRALENLLPGSTVENFIIKMFDRWHNLAAEGTDVLICLDGFCILDAEGLNRKVDSHGCVDLSGILKVTADYGESVSLSVRSENEEIFKIESLIEKRAERIQLNDAPAFERDEAESTPYSRMILTPPSEMASTTNPGMVAPTHLTPSSQFRMAPAQETPSSEFRVLSTRESPSVLGSQTGLMDIKQYIEILKEKLDRYSERKVEVDESLKCLEVEHKQAEQELSVLQATMGHLGAAFQECLSSKESMMKLIKEKHQDTAASVFCDLYKKAPPPQSLFMSKKGVFGIVALLGSVASTSLTRVLSEYLGEETMLALVCKSSRFVQNNAEYSRLYSEAEKLGSSITRKFHVLCLDATRRWDKLVENDPQRKLAMDDPKLPNGDPIPGFKGYAVNMIDLGPEELTIQTKLGHGLRETLFFGLFGKLQVYETQEHVEEALPYINGGGAVSLDGFITKESGLIYYGSSTPEIHFPITVREDEEEKLRKLEAAKDKVTMVAKKIAEGKCLLDKLEKKLKKANERYYKARQVLV